jgi:hypothetical protein
MISTAKTKNLTRRRKESPKYSLKILKVLASNITEVLCNFKSWRLCVMPLAFMQQCYL